MRAFSLSALCRCRSLIYQCYYDVLLNQKIRQLKIQKISNSLALKMMVLCHSLPHFLKMFAKKKIIAIKEKGTVVISVLKRVQRGVV